MQHITRIDEMIEAIYDLFESLPYLDGTTLIRDVAMKFVEQEQEPKPSNSEAEEMARIRAALTVKPKDRKSRKTHNGWASLIKDWLEEEGFDGLYREVDEYNSCGCGFNSFAPCTDGPLGDCRPAYKRVVDEVTLYFPEREES